MNKRKTIFLLIGIVIVVVLILAFFDRGIFFSFVNSQSISISDYQYGTFTIGIYNPNSGQIVKKNITGVMITINNVCAQKLTVTALFNSTFSITNPTYYIQVEVPASNGTVVSAFEEVHNIYLGYVTIFIPTPKLYPGTYIIALSDGMDFSLNLK